MVRKTGWCLAIISTVWMIGCGGSEYRFGNTQRVLSAISVTPGAQTLTAAGQTAQFIATGAYNTNPPSQDLTAQAQWSSSAPSVVTVSSSGIATAVATGTATISATANGVTGSATVTVSLSAPPPTRTLTSITVTPTSQTLSLPGQQAQFVATGNYSAAPTTQDLTTQVQWFSSAVNVATVSAGGLATAIGAGNTTITASVNGVVGTAALTVTASSRTLVSISVIPSSQTAMTIDEPGQFIAVGNYTSAPLTQDLTTQVIWSSSDVKVAEVTGAGVVHARGGGSATITANSNGVVGTATLTVTAAVPPPRQLTSITVIPSSQTTVTVGQTAQFIAIGNYIGNPATQDLTNQVTWKSSATSVADFTTPGTLGLATTASPGTTTITALDSSGVAGTATLTATSSAVPNQLAAINVIPSAQTAMMIGDLGQFIAIGSYTGSPSTANITTKTTWSSSALNVATVNSSGLATAIGPGTATLTAVGDGTSGTNGVVGTATLTVTATAPPGELTAITVIPDTQPTLFVPETIQFLAIGTFNSIPYTRDITNEVQWSSSDTLTVTIDATGLAAAVNTTQKATIVAKGTALSGAVITGTATVSVASTGGPGFPVLTVYSVGDAASCSSLPLPSKPLPQQNGVYDTNEAPPIIVCPPNTSGTACSGTFANHTDVTLVAQTLKACGFFGGFSLNCTPVVPDPNAGVCTLGPQVPSCTCRVHMENSQSVGAIFNLF